MGNFLGHSVASDAQQQVINANLTLRRISVSARLRGQVYTKQYKQYNNIIFPYKQRTWDE